MKIFVFQGALAVVWIPWIGCHFSSSGLKKGIRFRFIYPFIVSGFKNLCGTPLCEIFWSNPPPPSRGTKLPKKSFCSSLKLSGYTRGQVLVRWSRYNLCMCVCTQCDFLAATCLSYTSLLHVPYVWTTYDFVAATCSESYVNLTVWL